MRRAISSRIEQLEMAVPTPQPTQLSKEEMERRNAKLLVALSTTLAYSTLRHADLSLEHLLTLARDDNEAEIAREYEIRVLERDAKIDADTALCLRKNLLAHFFASDAAPREPLAELPQPIEFDEAAALKAARLQCPHFDSLSLEGQLKYLEEDLLKKRQRAATSRQHAEAVALRAPGSKEALNARIDASMWELGPGPGAQWGTEYQITKLKEKIAERDRSSRPSDRETSATA